jgi:hypothetical protein
MKRYIALLLSTSVLAASSYTQYFDLEKPADGDSNWGNGYRANLDAIDLQLHLNLDAITGHVGSVTAHTAAHISATAGGSVCTSSTNVQSFLTCLDTFSGDFVDRSSAQTITGQKTFTAKIIGTAGIQLTNLTASRAVVTDSASNLAVSSATVQEVGYLSGVTGSIQTQINNINTAGSTYVLKAGDTMTGDLGLTGSQATASRALILDSSSRVASSSVTSTELGYVSGATANIQGQINSLQGATSSLQTQVTALQGVTGNFVLRAGDTMTAQLALINGSAGTPSISFTREQNSGVYSSAAGRVAFSSSGVYRGDFRANGTNGTLLILGADATDDAEILLNTASNRIVINGGSGTTNGGGIQLYGGSEATTPSIIKLLTAASERVRIQNGNSAATPSLVLAADTDTGFYRPAADQLSIAVGGTQAVNISTSSGSPVVNIPGLTASRVVVTDASKNLASSAAVDTTEIEYLDGATGNIQTQINNLSVGSCPTCVQKAGDTMTGALKLPASTAAAPALTTNSFGQNEGLFWGADRSLSMSMNGVERMHFQDGTIDGSPGSSGDAVLSFQKNGSSGEAALLTYSSGGSNYLAFYTNSGGADATEKIRIPSGGGLQTTGDGTASAPIIARTTDTNSGIWFPAADQMAVAVGGATAIQVTSAAVGTAMRIMPGTGTGVTPYVGLKAPADVASYDIVLPTSSPSALGVVPLLGVTGANSTVVTSWDTNRTLTAVIDVGGSITITRQDQVNGTNWISATLRNGSGDVTLTIATGIFSASPVCSPGLLRNLENDRYVVSSWIRAVSATSLRLVWSFVDDNAAWGSATQAQPDDSGDFFIMCRGPI